MTSRKDLPEIVLYHSRPRLVHDWIIPLDGVDGRRRRFHGLGYLHSSGRCRLHAFFRSALHAQTRHYVPDIFRFHLQPIIDMCLYEVCLKYVKEVKPTETKRLVYTVITVTKTQLAEEIAQAELSNQKEGRPISNC